MDSSSICLSLLVKPNPGMGLLNIFRSPHDKNNELIDNTSKIFFIFVSYSKVTVTVLPEHIAFTLPESFPLSFELKYLLLLSTALQ